MGYDKDKEGLELFLLGFNYLKGLHIDTDEIDQYEVTNLDTRFKKIILTREIDNNDLLHVDRIFIHFNEDRNFARVVADKLDLNRVDNNYISEKDKYYLFVKDNRLNKTFTKKVFKNDNLIDSNTAVESIEVGEGYNIIDGYPSPTSKQRFKIRRDK